MNDELRRRAEKLINASEAEIKNALSLEETRRTLHELHVYQIELEIQNEELRRTQTALEAVRARYFDLYDLAPVGYVTIGPRGLILEANFTAATLLGVSKSVLVKLPISRFIFKDDQDLYYLQRKQLLATGEPQTLDLRMMKTDGTLFWANLAASFAKEVDGADVSRVVISDITVRKLADDLHKQIDRVIQHDLRTPAGNAVNIATLLLNYENLTEEQRNLLSLMKEAGQEMVDTLNRALDIFKIETGQYQRVSQVFDCLPLIRKIVDNLQHSSHHALAPMNILVDGASPAANTSCPCLGEPKLLRAALQNLLKNALEASPTGNTVFVSLVSGVDLSIDIRNQGAVPLDVRNRFFEKYATSGKKFGTGLGNYSAKMIIEAQGGSINMRTSDESNETIITIHLPVRMF